jgi:hypothetical protein
MQIHFPELEGKLNRRTDLKSQSGRSEGFGLCPVLLKSEEPVLLDGEEPVLLDGEEMVQDVLVVIDCVATQARVGPRVLEGNLCSGDRPGARTHH